MFLLENYKLKNPLNISVVNGRTFLSKTEENLKYEGFEYNSPVNYYYIKTDTTDTTDTSSSVDVVSRDISPKIFKFEKNTEKIKFFKKDFIKLKLFKIELIYEKNDDLSFTTNNINNNTNNINNTNNTNNININNSTNDINSTCSSLSYSNGGDGSVKEEVKYESLINDFGDKKSKDWFKKRNLMKSPKFLSVKFTSTNQLVPDFDIEAKSPKEAYKLNLMFNSIEMNRFSNIKYKNRDIIKNIININTNINTNGEKEGDDINEEDYYNGEDNSNDEEDIMDITDGGEDLFILDNIFIKKLFDKNILNMNSLPANINININGNSSTGNINGNSSTATGNGNSSTATGNGNSSTGNLNNLKILLPIIDCLHKILNVKYIYEENIPKEYKFFYENLKSGNIIKNRLTHLGRDKLIIKFYICLFMAINFKPISIIDIPKFIHTKSKIIKILRSIGCTIHKDDTVTLDKMPDAFIS